MLDNHRVIIPMGSVALMQASAQISMESSTGRVFEGPAAVPTAQNLAAQDRKLASAGAEPSVIREQEEQLGAFRALGQMLGARKVGPFIVCGLKLAPCSTLTLHACSGLDNLTKEYFIPDESDKISTFVHLIAKEAALQGMSKVPYI